MTQAAHILSFDEMKRSRNKAKAGRAFTRQFGQETSDAAQNAPRAAVYRGQMGRTQRRASRMQESGNHGMSSGSRFAFALSLPRMSSRFIVVMGIIACLCMLVICLYPTAQRYYVNLRTHDQLQAEAEAVSERTAALAEEVEYLQTDEGVEAYAREELGWIKEGENAVLVYGLSDGAGQKANNADTQIASGSIPAPETWYSPVLDVIFGVDLLT